MSQIWNSVLQNTAAIFQLKIVGKERTRTAGSEGLKDSSHFCSSYKTNTLGREAGESAGMRAKVDEVWAVEKCSVTGARPVHLVVQLLYGLLWEDGTGLFKHEKRQKTESHCCDLKHGAVWQADCHPNLAGLKAESSERGAAKSEWGWEIDVLFFADTQDCQLSVLVEQLFFPCKWLLTVGENSQIKWYVFIHASALLGNSMSSDFLSWFLCTGSLLPLAETGAQGVIAMLSWSLITFDCLTQDLTIVQDLHVLWFAMQFSTNAQ